MYVCFVVLEAWTVNLTFCVTPCGLVRIDTSEEHVSSVSRIEDSLLYIIFLNILNLNATYFLNLSNWSN